MFVQLREVNTGDDVLVNAALVEHVRVEHHDDEFIENPPAANLVIRMSGSPQLTRYVPLSSDGSPDYQVTDHGRILRDLRSILMRHVEARHGRQS